MTLASCIAYIWDSYASTHRYPDLLHRIVLVEWKQRTCRILKRLYLYQQLYTCSSSLSMDMSPLALFHCCLSFKAGTDFNVLSVVSSSECPAAPVRPSLRLLEYIFFGSQALPKSRHAGLKVKQTGNHGQEVETVAYPRVARGCRPPGLGSTYPHPDRTPQGLLGRFRDYLRRRRDVKGAIAEANTWDRSPQRFASSIFYPLVAGNIVQGFFYFLSRTPTTQGNILLCQRSIGTREPGQSHIISSLPTRSAPPKVRIIPLSAHPKVWTSVAFSLAQTRHG